MAINKENLAFVKKVPRSQPREPGAPQQAGEKPCLTAGEKAGVKRRDVKILCYWCQEKYWAKTPHTVLQDDEALFLREMTGFEAALRPYLMNGYEIKQVCHNRHVDYFVIFLEKELG